MPALEMAQESGTLVSWLKREGEAVAKGEPLMEIETDKVTVEIEAPASGKLGGITAKEGDVIPVGHRIAWILTPGEQVPNELPQSEQSGRASTSVQQAHPVEASPVARKIAEEHGVDLEALRSNGKRIEKADVLAYLDSANPTAAAPRPAAKLMPASPKARRLASERGIDLRTLRGSGPEGAILAADVPEQAEASRAEGATVETPSTVWRVMAEHMSASWAAVPHFYLVREVDASRLVEWRERITAEVEKKCGVKPTYTDLLVRLIGSALREYPRMNAAWAEGKIELRKQFHVGVAVATDEGLVVPVIRNADATSIADIAAQRKDLVERAQNRKLRPADINGGTFTLTNLGMYGVDAFQAIVNSPQAAILAVGRIAERVVPVNGQVVVRPMMIMTLSCDHRIVDGARAAQFLDAVATLIEDPWKLLA